MNIKTGDPAGMPRLDLDPTRGSRDVNSLTTSRPASVEPAPSSDSIALSFTRDLVQQALTSGDAARAARIAELRGAIADGSYQVDAVAVSRALIEDLLAGD
jgi:flagellar biosynthesis anti-sigma factor FlgM